MWVHLRQFRSAKLHVVVLRYAVLARHFCTDRLTHFAARAIRTNRELASDDCFGSEHEALHRGADTVGVLLRAQKFRVEANLDAWQRNRMLPQHFFQNVLRYPLAGLGVKVVFCGIAV